MRSPEDTTGGLLERSSIPLPEPDPGFALAAGGLRRLRGRGAGFLGHSAREMFWRDVLELVHEDDLLQAEDLVSAAIKNPGTSLTARLRFRDADGWLRMMDFSVQNVPEAPGDMGLVFASARDSDETLRPEGDALPPSAGP